MPLSPSVLAEIKEHIDDRHFYASTLLAQSVSIKELATYLGHADPGLTLRVYTHLVPSSHKRARLAVDTVVRPAWRG